MHDAPAAKPTFAQGWHGLTRALGVLRRLFPGYFARTAATALLEALPPLATLALSARVLEELSGARALPRIALYAGLAVGIPCLASLLRAALARRISAQESTFWHVVNRFKSDQYARMDYEHVENSQVNALLADINAKENANSLGFLRILFLAPGTLRSLFSVLGSAALLSGVFRPGAASSGTALASPWVSAGLAALLLLPILLRLGLMRRAMRIMRTVFEQLPFTNNLFMYYYRYVRVEGAGKDIRIFGQQAAVSKLMRERCYDWFRSQSRMQSETAGLTAAANALVSGCTYLLIGLRALAGLYGVGQVAQYAGAVNAFSAELSTLISRLALLWENTPYLDELHRFLDLPRLKYQGTLTTEKRADNDYEIAFHDVSFRYPGAAEDALRHVSLQLRVGERLAVVGLNGSGKTTLIKLLCRLYDPTEGHITLNGIDIRKYDYDEYLNLFSVVFQDFELPALPLGQSIAAAPQYDEARVREALARVGFTPHLEAWPDGLDTPLYPYYDKRGVTVSGGEAQKIALARAMYRGAPFIILDEPTAALDPIAEYGIYTHFDSIVAQRTAIYISHRLSSCRFCHDIAVFHEGRVIQRGSHEALLADPDGQYAALWNAQAQYYDGNGEAGDAGALPPTS